MNARGRVRRASGARPCRRFARADRLSLLVLAVLPVAAYSALAIAGRPLLPGDDLTQNYPLRVFVGDVIRSGHLPGWDPYLWSGTPLLAGWNAGAMFPGTWLFGLLPGPVAWTANLGIAYVVCGTGTYAFLRHLGARAGAAFPASLVFTYTGFMNGQLVHIGLVQGTALLPWVLLAVDGLAGSTGIATPRSDLAGSVRTTGWVLLLGAASALTVLAGDPRAVSTMVVLVAIVVLSAIWRVRGRAARYLAGLAGATVLGAALSAVQWLPGITFLHGSQRGVSAYSFFGSGSLSLGEIGSLLVLPFVLGGNGNFGLVAYSGNYNLPEVTIGVGLVALVAACALLPELFLPSLRRIRHRVRPSTAPERPGRGCPDRSRDLGVWYLAIVVGIALSLGTRTPLGHVLVNIPFFGGERLQNRNFVIVDLALAVLLAYFLDDVVAGRHGEQLPGKARVGPLSTPARQMLALVPVGWLVALVVWDYLSPAGLQGVVGVIQVSPDLTGELSPYLLATVALGMVIVLLVVAWHRIGPEARRSAMILLVFADITTYVANGGYSPAPEAVLGASSPLSASLARLTGTAGRFAIFNPNYEAPGSPGTALDEIGVTDLNVLRHISSVQGYGSIVQGTYQNATSTHELEGLDQTRLAGSTFDDLDLETLLTLPGYLQVPLPERGGIPVAGGKAVTPSGAPAGAAQAADTPSELASPTGPWTIAPGRSATWLLASTVTVVRATIAINHRGEARPDRVDVSLRTADGGGRRFVVPVTNGIAELEPHTAERAEQLVVENPTRTAAVIGAVVAVTRRPDERLLLDGALQGELPAPHWHYEGTLGPFVVFKNTEARGPAWIEAPRSSSPAAPVDPAGSVTTGATLNTGAQTTYVDARKPVELVRSVTYANGWTARITPSAGGTTRIETVRQIGLVQSVELPAGDYKVSWRYAPSSLLEGLVSSSAGAVMFLALCALYPRRTTGRRRKSSASRADTIAARTIE